MRRPGVVEPEENDAHRAAGGGRHDFAKVKIKGQEDSLFRKGFLKNGGVGQAMEVLFPKVNRLMSFGSEPPDDPSGDSHVGQKSHAPA